MSGDFLCVPGVRRGRIPSRPLAAVAGIRCQLVCCFLRRDTRERKVLCLPGLSCIRSLSCSPELAQSLLPLGACNALSSWLCPRQWLWRVEPFGSGIISNGCCLLHQTTSYLAPTLMVIQILTLGATAAGFRAAAHLLPRPTTKPVCSRASSRNRSRTGCVKPGMVMHAGGPLRAGKQHTLHSTRHTTG